MAIFNWGDDQKKNSSKKKAEKEKTDSGNWRWSANGKLEPVATDQDEAAEPARKPERMPERMPERTPERKPEPKPAPEPISEPVSDVSSDIHRSDSMQSPSQSTAQQQTEIGKDCVVKGEISSSGRLVISGEVEGKLHVDGELVVEESGRCKADVCANVVTVAGIVEGDIMAIDRFEVKPAGTVVGDVKARKIVIAEGARFKGTMDMEMPEETKLKDAKNWILTKKQPPKAAKESEPKVKEPQKPPPKAKEKAKASKPEVKKETKSDDEEFDINLQIP